jgi:hypothetical protein
MSYAATRHPDLSQLEAYWFTDRIGYQPQVIGRLDTPGYAYEVAVRDTLALVADGNSSGLHRLAATGQKNRKTKLLDLLSILASMESRAFYINVEMTIISLFVSE